MISKVSDIIAQFLKDKEITISFGIIGSANSHIFDSIAKLGYTQIVYMHHEQACVMAAGAYYRTCGKMSAALVTAGAGSSNAITGVLSNWADSIPCLVISGQESSFYLEDHKHLRMKGTQGFDSPKMVKDITKYSNTVSEPEYILYELEKAYHLSLFKRPGPVWIDVPFDIQSKLVRDVELYNKEEEHNHSSNSIEKIIKLLTSAHRPLILGGHGIKLSNSRDKFRDLVSKLRIPTLLSWSGIDLLEDTDPYYFGRSGIYGQRAANFIIQNCDLLLVLGSRLSLPQTGYDFNDFAPNAKKVMINIDREETKKYPYDYTYQEDCGYVIEELLKSADEIESYKLNWIKECKEYKINFPNLEPQHKDKKWLTDSYQFIDKLSGDLKDDHVIVTDMGTALLSGHQNIRIKKNQTMFTSLGLGEMGYGLPGAIGAAFATKRPILCMNCDGGMMMNLQELQTIISYKLPIKIIIFNNDGYLMIKHTQKMLFDSNYVGVDTKTGLGLPNYRSLANALGFQYYQYTNDAYWIREKFINDINPSILEVFMDAQQDFSPKVKGVLKEDMTIFSPPLEEMSPLVSLEIIKKNMIIVNDKSYDIHR